MRSEGRSRSRGRSPTERSTWLEAEESRARYRAGEVQPTVRLSCTSHTSSRNSLELRRVTQYARTTAGVRHTVSFHGSWFQDRRERITGENEENPPAASRFESFPARYSIAVLTSSRAIGKIRSERVTRALKKFLSVTQRSRDAKNLHPWESNLARARS